jgi:hypothetical protein
MIQSIQVPDSKSFRQLPRSVRDWIDEFRRGVDWDDSHWITLATLSGRVQGFHLYRRAGETLKSEVTWVSSRYQRQGVASLLWCYSLGFIGTAPFWTPKRVEVTTCSDGGLSLVKSLQREHKSIKFKVIS